jgi:tripartite-type tricarboxylate transporter receptor subunit TctC
MIDRFANITAAVSVLACANALASTAFAQQSSGEFYRGKTVKIVCALKAGGSYDAYARLASRHIGKHIPGKPSVIVENMPGAGGIVAANYLANTAAKDGTVLGALHQGTTTAQLTVGKNVRYDVRRMNWIGRMASAGNDVHYTWRGKGIESFDDMFKRQVIVAGGGPTSMSVILPSAVNKLMGAKLKILSGYQGTSETELALERGEVEMALQNWEDLRVARAAALRDNKLNIVVQYALKRHPGLPNVPAIIEKAKTAEHRDIWTVLLQPNAIGYSIAAGPDVPAARVAILRKAFDAMAKDPGLLAEAEKSKAKLEPLSGEQIAGLVADMFKVDKASIAAVQSIMGKK